MKIARLIFLIGAIILSVLTIVYLAFVYASLGALTGSAGGEMPYYTEQYFNWIAKPITELAYGTSSVTPADLGNVINMSLLCFLVFSAALLVFCIYLLLVKRQSTTESSCIPDNTAT